MPKRRAPLPPVELPPEITVVESGPDDVKFVFPRRQLGLARHAGWSFLAAGALYLYWIVGIGVRNLTTLTRPVEVADYFMVGIGLMLGGLAYFPLGLGLAILVGRREVTLRGGKLRTTERVGFLARTKRWPLATLDSVQIVGFVPAPAEGHKEGTLLSRLDALSGVLTDGTRFMVVPAYPRRLLAPFAAELARRCDARFDTTEYRRPKVQVTTLVSGDAPAAEHDYNVDQPADSRVVLEEYPEGVTITVPPLGFGGASIALTLAGLAVMGVTGSVAASMEAPSAKAYGICAAIAFVGLMLALHGVRVARRRVVIAIVLPQLMILQTGLVRSLRRTWDVGELMTVRVGPSGIQVNEEDVLELQIVPLSGPKFGLLCGRDVPEIRWIAGVLRRCLNVPARLAAPSEK